MADFLEEVLYSTVKYGSSWDEAYNVNVVETAGGSEYRSLIHPFPKRTFSLDFELATADMWPQIIDLYHRAHGTYAGFRAWCHDEDSSNGPLGTPTATDQLCLKVSSTVWQLRKFYGIAGTAGASGYPYRVIKKPQAGTVLVAVNGSLVAGPGANWTVDTATGLITLSGAIAATVVADNVRAGFRFHFPVRFKTVLPIGQDYPLHRVVDGVEFIELLNP